MVFPNAPACGLTDFHQNKLANIIGHPLLGTVGPLTLLQIWVQRSRTRLMGCLSSSTRIAKGHS